MSAPASFDPMPPLPATPTPGEPGDFDFLTGEWRIHNRSLVNGEWLEYPGEATVHAILAGVGSVEELRIPARNFSGMAGSEASVASMTTGTMNALPGAMRCDRSIASFHSSRK